MLKTGKKIELKVSIKILPVELTLNFVVDFDILLKTGLSQADFDLSTWIL